MAKRIVTFIVLLGVLTCSLPVETYAAEADATVEIVDAVENDDVTTGNIAEADGFAEPGEAADNADLQMGEGTEQKDDSLVSKDDIQPEAEDTLQEEIAQPEEIEQPEEENNRPEVRLTFADEIPSISVSELDAKSLNELLDPSLSVDGKQYTLRDGSASEEQTDTFDISYYFFRIDSPIGQELSDKADMLYEPASEEDDALASLAERIREDGGADPSDLAAGDEIELAAIAVTQKINEDEEAFETLAAIPLKIATASEDEVTGEETENEPEDEEDELLDTQGSCIQIYNKGNFKSSTYTPKSIELDKGITYSVYARVVNDDETKEAEDQHVTFSSDNTKVFTVDAVGNIVTKGPGTAVLTVRSETYGIDATLGITVKQPVAIKSMKISDTKVKGVINEQLAVTVTMDKGLNGLIEWREYGNDDGKFTYKDDKKTTNVYGGLSDTLVFSAQYGGVYTLVGTAYVSKGTSDCEHKEVSCTVTIDGPSSNYSALPNCYYYKDGKKYTGWVGLDEGGKYVADKSVLRTTDEYTIFYYEPSSMMRAKGLWTIGGKYYYFEETQGKLVCGTSDYDTAKLAGQGLAVNRSGEIYTGWIESVGKRYYYNPSLLKDAWIYDRSKKGNVFVNKLDGSALDGNGPMELYSALSSQYAGNTYLLKDGVMQTGFVYLDESNNIVKKNKAKAVCYADPDSGLAKKAEFFTVGGKTYYANASCYIARDQIFTYDASHKYYADKDGVIAKNKVVKYGSNSYYAGEDGNLLGDKKIIINGKCCYRNEDGILTLTGVTIEYYFEKDVHATVVAKAANSSKPADGVYYYKDDGSYKNKLSGQWLYKKDGTDFVQVMYLDKSGKPVTGVYKVGNTSHYFDPVTAEKSTDTNILISWKGKKYWIGDQPGEIAKENVVIGGPGEDHTVYAVKSDGQPESAGIRNILGSKCLILEDGRMCTEPIALYKGKFYVNNVEKSGGYKTGVSTVATRDKAGFSTITGLGTENFYIQKDGTIKTGWITDAGNKYYQPSSEHWILTSHKGRLTNSSKRIYLIDKKLYSFGIYDAMQTGWQVRSTDWNVYDWVSDTEKKYVKRCAFFFESNGAAATGWKSNIQALELNNDDTFKMEGGAPVVSSVKKKIYFLKQSDGYAPMGALAGYDQTTPYTTIDGKIYRFKGDGTVVVNTGDVDGDGNWRVTSSDGSLLQGRSTLWENPYYYATGTGVRETSVFRLTKGKWYYYGSDGRQSTSVSGKLSGGRYADAVFNKDGSLSKFLIRDGLEDNTVLKDAMLKVGDQYYLIGSKGLPVTGLNMLPAGSAGVNSDFETGSYFYCDSDGAIGSGSYDMMFVKSGKKIYVVKKSGVVPKGVGSLCFVDSGVLKVDYSRLPASDRAKYDDMKRLWGAATQHFFYREDGSLITGTTVYAKVDLTTKNWHTNSCGIVLEDQGLFCKSGKDFTTCTWAPSSTDMVEFANISNGSAMERALIARNSNNKVLQIKNRDTGAPFTGLCRLDEGGTKTYLYYFKDGYIQTGNQTINIDGKIRSYYFDNESGAGYQL